MLTALRRKQLFQAEAKNHTIIGTVVVAALAIQPFLGVLHHRHYVVNQARGAVSHVHIWWGRSLMAIGVINGGIGLQISNASNDVIAVYAVIAAVIFVCYALVKGVTSFGRRRAPVERVTKESGHNSPREAQPPRRPYEEDRRNRDHGREQYRYEAESA